MTEKSMSFASINDKIASLVLGQRAGKKWIIAFVIASALTTLFFFSLIWLFVFSLQIWGINIPVAWGFAITNFIWWIGIGHAGTFISAILLLLRQKWRTSINRFAEAMTLIAVLCAGVFPIIHLGRPWFAYWLFPYPNNQQLLPQFRSPLMWDVFAISTYIIVSFVFWFIGLVPDFAVLRDKARTKKRKIIYGVLAMGWRGSARHWQRYEKSYFILAALAAPLVVSVHTIVSLDFSVSQLPGWHSTLFPPYFVAGAIYSGFAMVLTLAIPLRYFYKLEDFITVLHLKNSAKVLLAMGIFVGYSYFMEIFLSLWNHNVYESFVTLNRFRGPYAPLYWISFTANIILPQILWMRKFRESPAILFALSLIINIGMWLERFIIVVVSLHRDFLPSSWGMFYPTKWDIFTFAGSIGFFTFLFLIFIRVLPVISIAEMKKLVDEEQS